jgi:hypothetical protein
MASTSPPSRATPATSAPQPSTPQPPAPSTLDILPLLTTLLTNLQESSQNPTQSATSASPTDPNFTAPITPKDIVALTDGMKAKIREARAQIARLPDMDVSLDEQEQEIRDLEERIRRQRKELERLKGIGGRAVDDGNKMSVET